MRSLSAVGPSQKLWDVENVEAHVRASLDSALASKNASLNADQYLRAYAFMWDLCWELSGLEADGLSLRWVFEVRGFYAPRRASDGFRPIKLQHFPKRETAQFALEMLAERAELVLTSIEPVRPRSAYNPSLGLSFSTYSRRMIIKRLPDWYRSDPEFGDNRYAGNRLTREVSLEGLAEQRSTDNGADDASFLDRRSPGARLEFVDDLNRHAYQESHEEVLMRETASG